MNTQTFLSKILPKTGVYVLAEFRNGLKSAPIHHFYSSVEELATAAERFDTNNVNVFHACATYKTNASRKQDNAGWMRSVWLDIDCMKANDAKSYSTRKEAVAELLKMCASLGLPAPMIVKSGMGLHVYWVLDKDLTKDEWQRITSAFSNALNSVNFKHDPSRTKDAASVLRPVGTHWRKDGVKPVELIHDAPEYSMNIFDHILEKYGTPVVPAAATMFGVSDDLGVVDYPPSSAFNIIKFCGAVREVAEAKGAVQEPLWRAMIGVVKHCTEGEDLCHDWSTGDPRYSYDETQVKIDGWTAGPTTCAQFSSLSTQCAGCKYNGKVKSPIQLGIEDPEEEQVVEVQQPTSPLALLAEPEAAPVKEIELPRGYRWDGRRLCALREDEDGVMQSVQFATQLFVITMRLCDEHGVMKMRGSRQVYPGVWRQFEFETSIIAQKVLLSAALAGQEVFTVGKSGQALIQQYVVDSCERLMATRTEKNIYGSLGWQDMGEKFVLGSVAITKDGEQEADVAPAVTAIISEAGVTARPGTIKGTVESWVEGVDQLYNYEGAEAAQFMILAGFASPLIAMMNLNGWNGIPIGVSGKSGRGKTRVANVACSIYGPPDTLQKEANAQGVTANSRIETLGRVRNLPYVFDEITNIGNNELADLLYAMSSGQNKLRLRPDGSPTAGSLLRWNMITFITCQEPIDEVLLGVKHNVHEATSLRCFGINVDQDPGWTFVNDSQRVEDLVNNNYGAVGRLYLTILAKRFKEIAEKASVTVNKYAPEHMEQNERFYRRLIATVMFAGQLAKSLNLIRFDLERIQQWAEDQVLVMRARRGDVTYSVEDYFGAYLGSIYNATIVTATIGDGRKETESPINPINGTPVARRVTDKANPRFIVSRKSLTDWCTQNKVDSGWFIKELETKGYVLHTPTSASGKVFRLGAGTSVPLPPMRVIEFDTAKLSGFAKIIEQQGNVVKLP